MNAVLRAAPVAAVILAITWKQRLVMRSISLVGLGEYFLPATFALALMIVPLILYLKRGRAVLLFGIEAFSSLLLYADLLYYRQFHDLLTLAAARTAGEALSVADSIAPLARVQDLKLFATTALFAVALVVARLRRTELFPRAALRPVLLASGAGAALLLVSMVLAREGIRSYAGNTWLATRTGPFVFHAIDTARYLARITERGAHRKEAEQVVRAYLLERDSAPETRPDHFGIARGMNLLIVQVESMQTFVVDLVIEGREISPNFNRLARENIYFPNFYTQIGQGGTADADFLVNCSQYPLRRGTAYIEVAGNHFRCLPQILRETGRRTAAFHPLRPDFYNLATVYPQLGFERFYSRFDFSEHEKIGYSISDSSLFSQTLQHLRAYSEPWYAFVISTTSHTPFRHRNLPITLQLGAIQNTRAGNYLHSIHYADRAIGELFQALAAQGLAEKTVVVLYGDHQGITRSNSNLAELLPIPEDDLFAWSEAERRVPLLIFVPGSTSARRIEQPAGQVDVAPTLLALFGEPPEELFMGRDALAGTTTSSVVFYEGSAITADQLYLSGAAELTGERCLQRGKTGDIPREHCADLAAWADEQLGISRLITEHDLVPKLRSP